MYLLWVTRKLVTTKMYNMVKVKKSYTQGNQKINVLSGIDLKIEDGEFLAIMGSSGAGKTTLINILTMIENYDDGTITFNDKLFKNFREDERDKYRKSDISIIFQDYNLINEMTVFENINLGKLLSNDDKNIMSVNEVTDLLNLNGLLDKYPEELSGGERQRVAVARSILNNAKCIFADEPTGALNRKNARILLDIFQMLNDRYKKTIVMVTHDPYVASFSNRLVFLKEGQIIENIHFDNSRKEYYEKIIHCLEAHDV